MHAVAPVLDWYVPAAHAAQTPCPPLDVIVPAVHALADVLPVAQAEPAGQAVQSEAAAAPIELRKRPTGHSSAALAPSAQ